MPNLEYAQQAAPGQVPKLAYSIDEGCQASGVCRATLYIAIKDGELETIKVGRRRLILAEDLARWLTSKRIT